MITMCQLPGTTSATATASAALASAISQSARRRSWPATSARNTAGKAKSRPQRAGSATRPPSRVPTSTPARKDPETASALPTYVPGSGGLRRATVIANDSSLRTWAISASQPAGDVAKGRRQRRRHQVVTHVDHVGRDHDRHRRGAGREHRDGDELRGPREDDQRHAPDLGRPQSGLHGEAGEHRPVDEDRRQKRERGNHALAYSCRRNRRDRRRYLMAIGLMIACTAPVTRDGPSVNRNSQA
jgi:hypothetical protein